jgi:hypothetical protein
MRRDENPGASQRVEAAVRDVVENVVLHAGLVAAIVRGASKGGGVCGRNGYRTIARIVRDLYLMHLSREES